MSTALQTDMWGGVKYEANHKQQVREALEKYPACIDDPSRFYWHMACERLSWLPYLDEEKRNDVKAFLRDIEGYRRRRQEVINELGLR